MHTDRNLLFGVLALQLDFISRDDLIKGMNAWALEKAKSLGQVLLDQGALRSDTRTLLEAVVHKHLELHGNDPRLSLAAVSTLSSVPQAFEQVTDVELQASLAGVSATRLQGSDAAPIQVAGVGMPTSAGRRFHILRPHARGGLGQVSVARDEELHREVALKEIQDRYADDPHSRARFVREAEITGGLEHPGVVPVYGLGQYSDGRPYYAMRFIKGDSLKDAIQQFHRVEGPDQEPGQRTLELRKLLGRFLDVCNAIAYAHSRCVLHRDLKPANIMLGPFGETLVVDWGVAKRFEESADGGCAVTERSQAASSSDLDPTQMGSTIGTPQFMSPEQATGRLDQVGPASDVYSLGATLYCLLTGQPPFDGNVLEVLQRVGRGEFLPPGQVTRGVPRALEAICLRAMALRPQERYASVRALADDVEHWLADEPVSAYREPLPGRLRRWARRHRTMVSGAVVLLATGVIGLVLGLWAVRAERDQARANLELANANFQLARKAVDEFFLAATTHPLLKAEKLRRVRHLLLQKALPFYQGFRALRPDDRDVRAALARNYYRVAYIIDEVGAQSAAQEAYRKAADLWERLARDYPEVVAYRSELAATYNNLGNLYGDAGQRPEALAAYERARSLRAQLAAAYPEDARHQHGLAKAYHNLGLLYKEAGRDREALHAYQRAQHLRERLTARNPQVSAYQDGLARTCNNLGCLHKDAGRYRAALRAYERARSIREKLSAAHPAVATYRSGLAHTYNDLGELRQKAGQRPEALRAYERARQIREKLVAEYAEVTAYHSDLAATCHDLGSLHHEAGRHRAALQAYERARSVREKLVREHFEVTAYRSDLGQTYGSLGDLLRDSGRPQDSLAWYARAIPLLQAVRQRDPDFLPARRALCDAYAGQAAALGRLDRHPQAVRAWDRALALDTGLSQTGLRLFRAQALARAGDHVRAVAEAGRLEKIRSLSGSDFENLAGAWALASVAVRQDANLSPADRDQLAEPYAARAVELLRKAQAAGCFQTAVAIDQLKNHTDFAALRSRAAFQKLLAELEEKARPTE